MSGRKEDRKHEEQTRQGRTQHTQDKGLVQIGEGGGCRYSTAQYSAVRPPFIIRHNRSQSD